MAQTIGIRTKAAIGGVMIVLASPYLLDGTKKEEGRVKTAYRDIAGVWTVCDGITGPDVVRGKTYSDAECNALTIRHMEAHGSALLDCIHVRITQTMYDGLAKWAYNVGVGAACKSTAIRLINAGQYAQGCEAIKLFNKARDSSQPKVRNPATGEMEYPLVEVRGLTLRRGRESAECARGIPSGPYQHGEKKS